MKKNPKGLHNQCRVYFDNVNRILLLSYISKFGNLDKMDNIISWESINYKMDS